MILSYQAQQLPKDTSMKPIYCKLIGIHGHAGVGKDTLADYIREKYENTWKLAFAGPLKKACVELFGLSIENFNDPDLKEVPATYWNISPRQMAQFFGTQMVRENIHHLTGGMPGDFWIRRMIGTLNGDLDSIEYDEEDTVLIPDVRFQNEYDWIISQGGIIIHITRPDCNGAVGIPNHASESGISFTQAERTYLICNNSTPGAMFAEAEKILLHAKIYPLNDPDNF